MSEQHAFNFNVPPNPSDEESPRPDAARDADPARPASPHAFASTPPAAQTPEREPAETLSDLADTPIAPTDRPDENVSFASNTQPTAETPTSLSDSPPAPAERPAEPSVQQPVEGSSQTPTYAPIRDDTPAEPHLPAYFADEPAVPEPAVPASSSFDAEPVPAEPTRTERAPDERPAAEPAAAAPVYAPIEDDASAEPPATMPPYFADQPADPSPAAAPAPTHTAPQVHPVAHAPADPAPAARPKPAAEPTPTASATNAYTIKKRDFGPEPTRPDQTQPMHMVSRRKQYLPTMYGLWWMATLVFFLLVSALIGFHALEYWGYDPLAIRWDDMQDKYVFLSLGGAMLATLFLIWILQNTAKGLTNSKPNPETAYNNVYGVMLCLLIIGSMKMTSDVMAKTTDARSGGQLQWLRDNAWGSDKSETPADAALTPTANAEAATTEKPTDNPAGSTSLFADPPAPAPSPNSPFSTAQPTQTKPTTTKPASTTGRNLPQARPGASGRNGTSQIRVGDPTKSVMAASMRAFQSAAGRARLADQHVMTTPQPDLANLSSAAPIEAVAMAHLEAFEAHLELARIAATLPDTARVQMLGSGASVERTDEQVASLTSLLSLDSAVLIQNAEAGVHGARAAYAGFLAQHFGEWSVEGGTVTFEDAESGATAVDLQKAIGQRETELKAARYDAVAG